MWANVYFLFLSPPLTDQTPHYIINEAENPEDFLILTGKNKSLHHHWGGGGMFLF